jgi:acyl-CoA synthetase (AMP-forming)/AMP-acid ligase II
MPGSDTGWTSVTTVGDLLVRAAELWGEESCFIHPERRLDFRSALQAGTAVARGLVGLGVGRGQHVGIFMPNRAEFVAAFFGCQFVGAVAVPINARYKADDLAYIVDHANLAAVLTCPRSHRQALESLVHEAVAESASTLVPVVVLGEAAHPLSLGSSELEAFAAGVPVEEVEDRRAMVRVRDVAMMMYTSGTTARPKGVPLTHEALVRTATQLANRYGISSDDRFWNPLPLFHMGALVPFLACVGTGAAFCTMTRFEAEPALSQIGQETCTFLYPAFPTITQSLVQSPAFETADLSAVRGVLAVGTPEVLQRVQAEFPGAAVVSSYGLTETGGISVTCSPDESRDARLTCGRPFTGMEVAVLDEETGRTVYAGTRGEILLRGVGLFEGYFRDDELTERTVDRDGWFHTGDLGSLDGHGRLTFRGRTKDMLKVGGENVAALEIETFLQGHMSVKLAQVVGVPDKKLHEIPAAFVELRHGHELTEEDILDYCQDRIASFKIPRHVRFTDHWPMSASKVQKFKLREQLLSELHIEEQA